LFALAVWLGTTTVFQIAASYGVGRHLWDTSIAEMYPNIMRLWVVGAMLYSATMMFIKLSILLLYRRLFPIDNFMIRWWIVTFFTVGYSVGGIFASLFQCVPVRSVWSVLSLVYKLLYHQQNLTWF